MQFIDIYIHFFLETHTAQYKDQDNLSLFFQKIPDILPQSGFAVGIMPQFLE